MRQMDNESIKKILVRLRKQANNCESEEPEKEIWDLVVIGTKDNNIRQQAVTNEFRDGRVQEVVEGIAPSRSAAVNAPRFMPGEVNATAVGRSSERIDLARRLEGLRECAAGGVEFVEEASTAEDWVQNNIRPKCF